MATCAFIFKQAEGDRNLSGHLLPVLLNLWCLQSEFIGEVTLKEEQACKVQT